MVNEAINRFIASVYYFKYLQLFRLEMGAPNVKLMAFIAVDPLKQLFSYQRTEQDCWYVNFVPT